MNTAARRWVAVIGIAVAGAATLSGCGVAPWDEAGGSATPTPTASVAPAPIPNDLSGGATARELTAGAVTAAVDYWSTLGMERWTATALKPVSLSMTTTVAPDDGQKVYLQSATMVAVPGTAEADLAPLEAQQDASTVSPGYLVLDPYSYAQTFVTGPVPDEATHVTLQFTFDFLVQTTPTSKEYAKQTATDTLTVALTD
jgi:hypothetical protein